MQKKDVCYITIDTSEPKYLKGQIVSVKEPGSEWSEIERGNKRPENSDLNFAVKTLVNNEAKQEPSLNK